jgi:cytochrome b involved in lipid metabolism
MKKSLAVVVLALVLSAVSAPGSLASVKAGATCKKAGLKSVAAGKQFTCVKKSGKLIWNKGVAVKASAKPSATATTKPTTSASATPSAAAPTTTKPSTAATVAAGYTMAQVKANKSRSKCWSAINGNVYDLTAWIGSHPGGESSIESLCGTDGSASFNAMHANKSKPESRLASYLLGPLTK